ncbi:MAG: ABC transporter permease [Burkholderiaceae bacterium]
MVSMLNRKLLRDLRSLWAQVLTIALVVGCGVGVFVGSLSTHESIKQSRDAYYQSARFADVFSSVKRAPQRLLSRLADIPGVAEVEDRLLFTAQISLPDVRRPLGGAIIGIPPGNPDGRLNRIGLRRGAWPEAGRSEVLVHESFARSRSLKLGDPVGILLNGRQQWFTISGFGLSPEYIFPAAVFGSFDESSFGVFWIDRVRLESAFDMKSAFNQVAVKLQSGSSSRAVMYQLDTMLAPFGSGASYLREDQPSDAVVASEVNQQRVFGLFMPAIFMAVAIFIINIVISRQVTTQRDQIAALKALGYPDRSIIGYYLELAALIVVFGSAIGLAIGWWYGNLMTGLYAEVFLFETFEFSIDPWVVWVPFGINLIAALVATLYATRSILKLSPAQAMRPPAPLVFENSLPDRLGLGKRLGPASNMIVRHLERHPSRTLLGVVGIAGAVAILISGTWWRDGIDYLLEVQFGQADRAGVQLAFTESVDRNVLFELRRLPGVLEAQTQRSVAVQLHNGPVKRRTAISGLSEEGRLKQVLDAERRVVAPTESGLLLGRLLADKLEVGVGDALRVEFLNRRAKDVFMPVTAIVDQMFGAGAYLPARELDRLAGDPGTVNWAGLMIDHTRIDALYDAVKQTPRVAGVVVKHELINHFNEQSGKNILIFTSILTVFASLIAVGVVYNSARISLAERAWEFATLRVLGMSEQEVSALLIGELIIALAIGIPIGFGAGWILSWLILDAMSGSDVFSLPLVIQPRTYAYAAVVMLLAGLTTGWIVRRRLGRLDLIGVLKTRE